MKSHPLLLLVLAARVQSWPQLSFDNDLRRDASPARLPVVDDHINLVTLPVADRRRPKRQLPVDEDLDMSAMTLPVSSRPGGRNEARQLHEDDVEIPVLQSSGPSSKRAVGPDAERRQLHNDDIEVPSLHSSAPSGSKRAVEAQRGLAGELDAQQKEARQLHDDDIDIPVLQSSGPSSRRAVEAKRGPVDGTGTGRKEARQFHNDDIEIPSLHSSGPSSRRAMGGNMERTDGRNAAQNQARQLHNDDVDIPVLQSSGPDSRRAVDIKRGLSDAPRAGQKGARQLPIDEDLDMSTMTLPVSPREKGGPHAERKARQFSTEDVDTAGVPSLHSSNPDARRHATSKRQLPVEDLDMSAMTLPLSTPTRPRDDAERNVRQLPEDDVGPGVLTLPVLHSTKPGMWKRAIEVELANRSDVAYYAQLNLGTPPQPVFVQLDTGSFELWVNPDCTSVSERDVTFCEAVGYYDITLSSTASETAGNQTLRYGIGAANITYVRDSIGLPATTSILRDVQFGVATETEDQFAGILGLGHGAGSTTAYSTFLDELVAQNVTPTRAFSLGLGSKNDQEGVITFGGVDTSKFAGGLAPVPLIPADASPDGVSRYWVQLEGMTLSPPGGGAGRGPYAGSRMPVFLDSGATLTLLPPDLAAAVAADFGAAQEDEDGFYPVDCALVGMEGTLDFAFAGVTVKVPYREMIRELRNPPSCYLGIVPSEDFTLLGDTFLRSAYVVFDPDDSMTYIAQYQNCGSTVTSLATTDTIPDLYGVCGLAENSDLPSAPSETDAGAETGGVARVGVGPWAFLVAAWWVVWRVCL